MLDKLQSLPPRIGTLIFETLPSLFFFPSFSILSGTLLTALYGLVVFFLILPFFWRGVRKLENRKFLPFLLYPFCFLITLSAAHYPVSYFPLPQFAHLGYFSPFYYFVFSLLALALRHKKRPAFFLWFFMGLGLIGQGSLLFREPWGRGFQYKGYSYMELGRTWGAFSLLYPFPQKLREFQRIADQYAESDRRFFYWGLATGMDAQMDSKMLWDAKRVVEAIDRIPSSYQLYFFDGWGSNLCRRTEGNLDDGNSALTFKNKIIELSKSLSRETLPYFYYGLVTRYPVHLPDQREVDCLGYMQERDFPQPSLFHFYVGRSLYFSLEPGERKEVPADIWNSLGRKEKGWVWRGLGAMAGAFSALRMNVANFNPLWINIPPEDRNDFYWGVGWGVIERMVEDPIRAFDMLRRLPTEAQKAAQEGFSEFERWYAIAPGDESNTRFEFHELSPRVK